MEKDYEYTGYNKVLTEPAKKLRKDMTPQERKLWYCFLKSYHVKFYKQRPIDTYIADFYCSKARLVVEIDGNQHYTKEGKEHDENRTYVIGQHQIEVVRFSNYDIDYHFQNVCEKIDNIVDERLKTLGK